MMNKKIMTAIITALTIAASLIVLLFLVPVEKKNQQRKQYGKLAIQAETDEKARYILDHAEEYPEEILNLYYSRDDFVDFVYNYPEHKNDYQTMSYTEEELNSELPPRLYMEDMRWCYQPMGGGYIATNGCAAVSMTMAYLYLYKDGSIDPYQIAVIAETIDAIGYWGGIDTRRIKEVALAAGMTVKEYIYCDDSYQIIQSPSIDEMVAVMENGHALLAGCRGEDFGDHAILITSYNDGMFTINDPASIEKSERLWSYEELASDIYFLWDLGSREENL